MAGADGVENRLDPGEPLDKDIYALSPAELSKVPSGWLARGALNALESDQSFSQGCVFTQGSRPGWSISAAGKSIPCACGRIPMSSSCISIFNPAHLVRGTRRRRGEKAVLSASLFLSLRFLRWCIIRAAIERVPIEPVHMLPALVGGCRHRGNCCRL